MLLAEKTVYIVYLSKFVLLMLVTVNMLTTLEKVKPRTMRIQKNPSNGQWSVCLPVEVVQGAELEKWDTVKFTVVDKGRILLEVLR